MRFSFAEVVLMTGLTVLALNCAEAQNRKLTRQDTCSTCNDIINNYCCRYQSRCCEYVTPDGCPAPAGPDARAACRSYQSCRNSNDCINLIPRGTRQCCFTSICGATCSVPIAPPPTDNDINNVFTGYRY